MTDQSPLHGDESQPISPQYFTKADLRARGWTHANIKQIGHDTVMKGPGRGRPRFLYSRQAVLNYEESVSFLAAAKKAS